MYGNERLPGVEVSGTYRNEGSIWRGAPEATWIKAVQVSGSEAEAKDLPEGTIVKEDTATGVYSPITESDIISATANLPGVRLGIVADKTAKTGTSVTTGEGDDAVTQKTNSTVSIGIHGQVDKARLLVGSTKFTELTDAQQINLNTQLEAWGFMLVNVIQG